MKIKMIERFLIIVASIFTLAFSATNAFALNQSVSVVSPFWQSDGSVYTFVAVSHTSLQAVSSRVGVIVTAIETDGSTFGSTSFTVSENGTQKLFIVGTNHTTINSRTITGSEVFIVGTTNLASGHLRVTASATNSISNTLRLQDITALSFWGSVVVPGTNTGFAMEFIGDTHDSLYAITSLNATIRRIPAGVN